jgi:16S rRNA (uracil1498-N3)-methyltransferase
LSASASLPVRIYVAPLQLHAGELAIRGDEHHYLGRVRRARVGDTVELIDGAGRRAAAHIVRISDIETIVDACEPEPVIELAPRVCALIPWIKGDRMDQCIEKLVEVGCDEVVIWPAARAVVQLAGDRLGTRVGKLRAAALAAARQCGRAAVPEVAAVASLGAAIANLSSAGARYVLDPASTARLALSEAPSHVAIASGPEGGLAPAELDALLAARFASLGLGPRTLRAETAPVIAVALVRAATAT